MIFPRQGILRTVLLMLPAVLLSCVKPSDPREGERSGSASLPAPAGELGNGQSYGGGGEAQRALATTRERLLTTLISLRAGENTDLLCRPVRGKHDQDEALKILRELQPAIRDRIRAFILENLDQIIARVETSVFDLTLDPFIAIRDPNGDQKVLARAPLGIAGSILFSVPGILGLSLRGRLRLLGHEISHMFIPRGQSSPIDDLQSTTEFPEVYGGRHKLDVVGTCLDWQTEVLRLSYEKVTSVVAFTTSIDHGEDTYNGSSTTIVKMVKRDGTVLHEYSLLAQVENVPSIALADFNFDGFPDIVTCSDEKSTSEVQVRLGGTFVSDGTKSPQLLPGPLGRFNPRASFPDELGVILAVAAGDVNGDRVIDVVVSWASQLHPSGQVIAFSGVDGAHLYNFQPFLTPGGLATGAALSRALLAVTDLDNDGIADILVAGGGVVKAFRGGSRSYNEFARDEISPEVLTSSPFRNFSVTSNLLSTTGVFIAAGDISGDGTPDLVVGFSSVIDLTVRAFDGRSGAVIYDFSKYFMNRDVFSDSIRVAIGDINNDGIGDIITASGMQQTAPGTPIRPVLFVWLGGTRDPNDPNKPVLIDGPLSEYFPWGNSQNRAGLFVGGWLP